MGGATSGTARRKPVADWWDVAYQRGLPVVIICGGADEIGEAYAQFVDKTYDLRGPFDAAAYDVVSLVLGIDRKSIPDSVLLEMADWQILFSSVRPGATVNQVLARISVVAWARRRMLTIASNEPRCRDLVRGIGRACPFAERLPPRGLAATDGSLPGLVSQAASASLRSA